MIEVQHLTKDFGNHIAVSDLNFTIPNGQIYGLLGPNGAGKSTTMNMLTGCLAATEGEIRIDGYDIFEDAGKAKSRIGYLPEQPPLYLDCTPTEYLTFVARAKKVPEKEIGVHIREIMEKTGVEEVADRLLKNLSKGYKQRVGIAQALVGDPEIIILDEPTSGLDPQQIIEIRDLVRRLGDDHTVILSSHILSEVEALCDTVMIISHGKLVACDTPSNLANMFQGTTTIRLIVDAAGEQVSEILKSVEGLTKVETVQEKDGRTSVCVESESSEGDELSKKIFFAFSQAGTPVLQMTMDHVDLEDIFVELTEEHSEQTEAESSEAGRDFKEAADDPSEEKTHQSEEYEEGEERR